jgi:hypothetical protein
MSAARCVLLLPFSLRVLILPLDAQYEVVVLKVHLEGSRLAFFLIPTLLLLLLLSLSYFLFYNHADWIDLADPLTTALLGLSSPQDSSVNAFASGRKQGETRIRLGAVRSNGRLADGKQLVLLTVKEGRNEEWEKPEAESA